MKKMLISFFAVSSMVLAPALKAGDVSSEEGTPVGQASNDGASAARKKRWQNIAIAAGAIIIAVTALILVASNDGHHEHKK